MPCSEAGGPPRGRGIGVGVEVGSGPGGLGPWGRTWRPLRLWERSCSLAWAASGRLRLHSLWGTWVFRGVSPGWSEVGSQLGWGVCFLIRPFPPRPPQTSERRLLVSAAGLGGLWGHDPPVHRDPAPAVVLQQEEVRHSQGQEELSGRRRPLRGEPRCSPESRWPLGRTPQPGPPSPGPSLPQPEARAWGSARASGSPPEAIGAGPPSAAAWALEGPLVHHWGAVGRGRRCDLVRGAGGPARHHPICPPLPEEGGR